MEKKTKKILIWIISVILGVIVLLAGIFVGAFASFDPEIKVSELSESDYFVGATVSQKVLGKILKSKKSSEISIIRLRNDEVNTMLRMAENGDSLIYLISGRRPKNVQPKNPYYKILYNEGVYYFKIKLTDTFCKLCLVADGKLSLEYKDGDLEIDIESLQIGRVEIPDFVKKQIVEKIYAEAKNEPAFDIVRNAVKKIEYLDDGSMVISYYPYRLKKYFIGGLF